ncbi:forkhead box protein M1-like [Anneissia japonica]|uniref:forkhead box protein M1-like n=1 Tax=Anneissia japonica TaxID=1529436 RepID=UPI001425B77E|nr:forkhead box protein M1-like [Anneissia japonica]XP_033110794.1 forkhead box protein M1-like [Anneissia japonica]XP_033110804.1 forkhead box protein M1-like [Anneissia japonica]
MDQNTLYYQKPKNNVLGDISNIAASARDVSGGNSSRLKEARLSFSRLTGSNIDPLKSDTDGETKTNVPILNSYDSLEEKSTPLKKRKRVYSVAILRHTKPKKENKSNEHELAINSEMQREPNDYYHAPSPSLDFQQPNHFTKMLNTDIPASSLGKITNEDKLYLDSTSTKTFRIDDGTIRILDNVKEEPVSSATENEYIDNVSSDTFAERDSIMDSSRSLTNMTWLRQLGDSDTLNSNQQQPLISGTHFPQIFQPMVQHHQRPPYSYSALIQFAISSSSTGRMTLREIYQWIEDNFPFFRTAKPGWKNSIRHNLSLHKMFIRQPPMGPGKSAFWTLQPGTVVRLPSKRNLNFHNENTELSTSVERTSQVYNLPNRRSGSTKTIGHQTKRPFLLPRPTINPALMHMPVVWDANTGTYAMMQTIPNNSIPMAFGTNAMVYKPQLNPSVVRIAPKMNFNQQTDVRDSMSSSQRWPSHGILQPGQLAVDSGFETDNSGGLNLFDYANASETKSNNLCPDIPGSLLGIKEEAEGTLTVSTPVKSSSMTPSKGISATSTPGKLFSELDFLSPIRGVTNLRTPKTGFSPLQKYLLSPSRDTAHHKSPMLGSLREFGLPGFTPKKDGDMNVSVHNQSFGEIFGDMNISLDMAAAAADISWSAFNA